MNKPVSDELSKKIRLLLAAIDAGAVAPDPLRLIWARNVLKDANELALARECERRARFLLPSLPRDLT